MLKPEHINSCSTDQDYLSSGQEQDKIIKPLIIALTNIISSS